MPVSDGYENYFSILDTVISAAEQEAESHLGSIPQALLGIAENLQNMAEPLEDAISESPHSTNLEELEVFLKRMYSVCRRLSRWVKKRQKKRSQWASIQKTLKLITLSEASIKSQLGSYMQKRGSNSFESQQLIKKRVQIGIDLEDLAEDIRESLTDFLED